MLNSKKTYSALESAFKSCALPSREWIQNVHPLYKLSPGLTAGTSSCSYTSKCICGCIYLPAQAK